MTGHIPTEAEVEEVARVYEGGMIWHQHIAKMLRGLRNALTISEQARSNMEMRLVSTDSIRAFLTTETPTYHTPEEYSDAARIHALQEMRGVINGFVNKATHQSHRELLSKIIVSIEALSKQERGCVMIPNYVPMICHVTSGGHVPVGTDAPDELTALRKENEHLKSLFIPDLTAAIDFAMVEMKNMSPPLRRRDCERLIRAAFELKEDG